MITRRSPIQFILSSPTTTASDTLSHPTGLIKLGLKGRGLDAWSEAHGLDLPTQLHDVRSLDHDGVVARVDRYEVILECVPGAPLYARIEQALELPHPEVYRVEQQSATYVLTGNASLAVLSQTCGYDFRDAAAMRIVYTRVAGVSCGIIPFPQQGARVYRVWVDCSLARYLWQQLTQILSELTG